MSGVPSRAHGPLLSGTLRPQIGPARHSAPGLWIGIWKGPALQAGLNPLSQGFEIADALNLVVGQLDAEMILEARKHPPRLEAVAPKLLYKTALGRERPRRYVKVLRG